MVIRCASNELKDDLIFHIQQSVNSLENFKNLNRGLLKEESVKWEHDHKGDMIRRVHKKPMSKEGYEKFQEKVNDAIVNYTNVSLEVNEIPDCKGEFSPLFGTLKCLPREIKQDLAPFLKRKAKYYSESGNEELSKEAEKLADVLQNKVCNCTTQGNPSGPWLYRRGFKKKDLVVAGNIQQLP